MRIRRAVRVDNLTGVYVLRKKCRCIELFFSQILANSTSTLRSPTGANMYAEERYSMHWGWYLLFLVVVIVGCTWKYFTDIFLIDKAGSEEIAQGGTPYKHLPPGISLDGLKERKGRRKDI
ncbi:hypothetical protein KFL_000420140 [Klebsormidium nitens]|uniref:Uncharacterized protein n=1 Tax=Klebsormidium nitens TaxID=105231 RepID=A0A1Y1HQ75_KLENI|nr:hypothetical protein KFL_000420140 [Klebsormidium nitens]|eukprot:GAQ79942.1 hypothetical protein KFL_000420140 [Klebsormidium nitens]